MDKRNTFYGIICIVLAILAGMWATHQQMQYEQYKKLHPELFAPSSTAAASGAAGTAPATASAVPAGTAAASANASPAIAPSVGSAAPPAPVKNGELAWLAPAAPSTATETTRELSNDYVTVTLTTHGGAVKSVTLKNFPAQYKGSAPLVFNANAPEPALTLSVPDPARANDTAYWMWTGSSAQAMAGSAGVPPAPLLGDCQIDEALSNNTSVTFHGKTADGLTITRTYSLGSGDEQPYLIHHTTTIVNNGTSTAPLARLFVNAGMAPTPPLETSTTSQYYLDFMYYDGSSAKIVTVSQFMQSKGALFGLIGAHLKQRDYVYAARPAPDLQWVSVKNQFFTSVLVPKGVLGSGFYARGVEFNNDGGLETTIAGDLELNLGTVAPGEQKKLELDYYVGPKEYMRLDKLGNHQDLIMQFGWFSGFSEVLLMALLALHKVVAPIAPGWAWGWSIVCFAFLIKLATWPFTAMQVRSTRRMQEFSGPMKAIREKYKDNPEKMNAEMMELYRKHKINPFAGCLPLLITFPIFISFNYVLRTSSEMRFQSFLWMHDLSMPDTIAHIGGFAVNFLPLIMGVTMVAQAHMMPASPAADPSQQRMMKFMPLMFIGFFYTMPSGMILYWTCQNLFTILQTYLTRRNKGPATPTVVGTKSPPQRL